MTQDVLFSDADSAPAPPTAPFVRPADVVLAVGDTFMFRGLPGQEPDHEARTPGSGSVGWALRVVSLSPWGLLGMRCAPSIEGLGTGRVTSVGFTEALAMIQHHVWERLDLPADE